MTNHRSRRVSPHHLGRQISLLEAPQSPETLGEALRATIETIEAYTNDTGVDEPSLLTNRVDDWERIPRNHLVTITPSLGVSFSSL